MALLIATEPAFAVPGLEKTTEVDVPVAWNPNAPAMLRAVLTGVGVPALSYHRKTPTPIPVADPLMLTAQRIAPAGEAPVPPPTIAAATKYCRLITVEKVAVKRVLGVPADAGPV